MGDDRPSVQPSWCRDLTLQQQSVLLLAARGPDGVEKVNPCKSVVQAYRGEVLVAAKYGRSLEYGEPADTFMDLSHYYDWDEVLDRFFRYADALPFHYLMRTLPTAPRSWATSTRTRWSEGTGWTSTPWCAARCCT